MMLSLSSSNHHKSDKEDKRKGKTKKKKHGDHHFEPGPKGVLSSSYLKLFPTKLKVRWSGLFEETNVSPYGATRRIKVDIQKLKEDLGGDLDHAKCSIVSPNPL
ncbi:hypothetical protein PanWU01x14_099610 [Parasponia andersonii]|uniref:Uncharacterized protein n=1 Tax=Parasponia andersonii TaxID=3476 RepID=A0A2P5D3U1_PARAD|nr:hypothetical protein PanWU01x14_099610 [Parasponia andersonii]